MKIFTEVSDRNSDSYVNAEPVFMSGAILSCMMRPDTKAFLYMAFRTDCVYDRVSICDLFPTNPVMDMP